MWWWDEWWPLLLLSVGNRAVGMIRPPTPLPSFFGKTIQDHKTNASFSLLLQGKVSKERALGRVLVPKAHFGCVFLFFSIHFRTRSTGSLSLS